MVTELEKAEGGLEEDFDSSTVLESIPDQAINRAVRIVAQVQKFKQPKLQKIAKYRNLYAGNVKPKYRQPFNVVIPVFSGAMDTLMSEFNDDLAIEMGEGDPSDYLKVKKFEGLWDMETTSHKPNAKFPYKTRVDRGNALFSGRGFMMNYAVSEPEYKNFFEIFEFEDAIFQPTGGGILESHLYKGRCNLVRSESQLKNGPYDQVKVNELLTLARTNETFPFGEGEELNDSLTKFRAAGLDAATADYVGENLFKLVEMVIKVHGVDYYLVFSPWYKKWVRFDTLSTMTSSKRSPFVSWATHEDNKNFASKSYADDMYGIADATHTLFNQELTNRERRNYGARAYDPDMFPDVAALDTAQTRPDALVRVNLTAGKKISDGLFHFETPELRGTINLIDWMNQEAGRDVGVTDMQMGGVQNVSKKASVAFAEQQNIAKRLLLRSSSYTEAMGEIAELFIAGAQDHLPARKAIRMLGPNGEGWGSMIRADGDLELDAEIDIKVKSSSVDMRNSQLKKDSRSKTLQEIIADPVLRNRVNPDWVVEEKLRSAGEYDDSEIAVATDLRNSGNKQEVARAYQAIEQFKNNTTPDVYFAATGLFLEIIYDYSVEYRNDIGEEMFVKLQKYISEHAEIANKNTQRKAQKDARNGTAAGVPVPGEEAPENPNLREVPTLQNDATREVATT